MSIWVFFTLLGSLALLMFGMKTMSEALQKMAGPQLRHVLGAMTIVCECWTVDAGSGHLGHYGCQHRYDADGMDYVGRYVVRRQ